MGVSFGLIPKIALGAFEYAWAPFYYATAREPDARRVFSAVTTYGVATLALMTAGLSAIATDLLDVVTRGHVRRRVGRRRVDGSRRLLLWHLPPHLDRPQHHAANAVLPGLDRSRGPRRTSG